MSLAKGTVIDGRYVVDSVLGEGSMAEVYKVTHQQLGTEHALKVLKLEHESVRERMMREGQFQAKLRHPNIVNVSDVVPMGDSAGLVMEYIDGGSLAELLRAHRLTADQVDLLARGLLDGVEAAHEAGLIHRDLKPANILLAREGKKLVPKITDFGLAKALDATNTLTKSGVMMGTPAYMAPEQIQDAKYVDQRADLFSVGAVLYHMVAGRRPFDHANIANVLTSVLDGDYPPVTDFAPHLGIHRVKAIEAALEVEVDDRVASCAVLRAMWTGEQLGLPRDSETTEGPFGSALLDSLSAPAVRPDIAHLATVIKTPDNATPAPSSPRQRTTKAATAKRKRSKRPMGTESKLALVAGGLGLVLLLFLATLIGFGLGSVILLWLQS